MAASIVQPRLAISYRTTWSVAQIILEHFSHAKEAPTFTIRAIPDTQDVMIWMSKRTFEWLRRGLELDPRAHKEEQ